MKAKEYLSQALYLDKRIKAKERQLDWLKAHAVYASPKLSEMLKSPVRGGSCGAHCGPGDRG
ncbi:MAG: hypothetical protein PF495_17720 [Spirochaetales bacterium]|jgi:hypothetical protein|nr:hypothetical protein [Spirochaetales bacterium]